MNENDTDSLFTDEYIDQIIDRSWADIRLLHESERGWCAVYTCLHKGRRIVLKTLKETYTESHFHQNLLKKEYVIGSMMTYRGIVSTIGYENVPELGACILLEYIDGITLNEYLKSNSKLSKAERLDLINQICSAVSYIHSRQIVHCDLKPSNILITRDGAFVKIIDFGLCRGVGFDLLDLPGGTQGFTAPENMQANGKATIASDIYSIGKIGEFIDTNIRLKSVWRKCLSIHPEQRPSNANEIAELVSLKLRNRERTKKIIATIGAVIIIGATWFYVNSGSDKAIDSTEQIVSNEVNRQDKPQTDTLAEISSTPMPSVKTIASHPIKVKEAENYNVDSIIPGNQVDQYSDINDQQFKAKFTTKLEQVTSQRFQDHITLIDTMTTTRSRMLVEVKHWRWLAKQDMRKWLEERLYPYISQVDLMMKEVENYVTEYSENPDCEDLELEHILATAEKRPEMTGTSLSHAYYEYNTLVVCKFKEDGEWHEKQISVPINRLDPVENERIRSEYMKKALEE
ncbi:MAG: serine/threonine protein kinase [Muribaculaceae bacterium]|nr:serine/threonine protein kinase [Muribaculaceae bacterium]